MKYFLAIFIFLGTASDPWIEMLRSGELANFSEIHEVAEHEEGFNHSSGVLTNHQHENNPCAENDCTECHTCHIGHCGTLVPEVSVKIGVEPRFLEVFYYEQISSIYLDGLFRPPKALI